VKDDRIEAVFVATDAPIAAGLLAALTREIADASFNCATVDGDTSTNDSFVIAATGKAALPAIERADDARLPPLRAALAEVATELAQASSATAGATRFITIAVEGGRDSANAARSRSASPIRRS
jgi:glutamate N-acetyltransferase/amino-acid N-acetyltransferase